MDKFDYPAFLDATGDEIQARIERARHYRHPTGVGDAREDVVRQYLQDVLHPRFVVDKGKIIDSAGNLSKEFDIIISESVHVAPMFSIAGRRIVPVESVYGVMEIKSSLTRDHYDTFLNNLEELDDMRRFYLRVPATLVAGGAPSKDGYKPSDPAAGILWGGIIAFDAPNPQTLNDYFKKYCDSLLFMCVPGRELVIKRIKPSGYWGLPLKNKAMPKLIWLIMSLVSSSPRPHLMKPDFSKYDRSITDAIGDMAEAWSTTFHAQDELPKSSADDPDEKGAE